MKINCLCFFIIVLLYSCSATAQLANSLTVSRSHQMADSILRTINGRQKASTSTPQQSMDTQAPIVNIHRANTDSTKHIQQLLDSGNRQQPASGSILTSPVQSADTALPSSSGRIRKLDSIYDHIADSTRQQGRKGDGSLGSVPQPMPINTQQSPSAGNPAAAGPLSGMAAMVQNMKMSIGHVYGKVLDGQGHKPMSYVSVSLYTMKDSLVTGQLTEDNGDFSFSDLRAGAYNVKVSFIGYKDLVNKVVVTPAKSDQDIGNLTISPDAKQLKEVDVTAQKSTVELKVDRKVFNVGNDIAARGGTGLDVMKNIPSVSIDASGNVTLRNNTPQVYVDGKPTTLTLEQIPADQIDRVEVITNPSAKFEAASSGGIINVVMKKNTKPGYNGIVNLNLATNTGYNGLAMINLKQKKFGVSLMYTINGATNRTTGYTNTGFLDATGAAQRTSDQNINSTFKRLFQVARVAFDFYINNRNTLTISENAVFGNFNTNDNIDISSDSARVAASHGNENNNQLNHFRNFTTDLNFKHTYPKEGKEYTIDIQYNYAIGGGNYLYATQYSYPSGNMYANNPTYENLAGGQHSHMLTAQWDLSLPIRSNMKIELGVRSNYKLTYSYNNVTNDSTINGTITSPDFNTALSNNYRIDDLVNAAYITFTHQIKGFSYQVGLRAEQVYYRGTSMISGDQSFSYQYPTDAASVPKILFPSFNISQKFGTKHELQFNVARKSNRPNFFQIAPFIFSSTATSVQRGNPALQPEFINQGELNYNLSENKVSWLTSIYGRYVQQPITTYIYPDSTNPNITITSYNNATHSMTGGWENILKLYPVKKLDITLTGNVFYTDIIGGTNENNASNAGWSWLAKALISYKLPLDFTIQANGTYEAPKILPQGKTTPLYYFDLALSKDFGFFTLNFSVSDVLNSRTNGSHLVEEGNFRSVVIDQSRRRDQRYAKLGVSFRFGKMDASLFKKKKAGPPDNGGGDMGF